MKNLQRFCAAVILTLTLALSAIAGDIPCPGLIGEPSPRFMAVDNSSNPGSTSTTPNGVAVDPVTEAVLSLLQSMLPIL
jgi:hypothetical protein